MAFLYGAHAALAAGQVRLELGDPGTVEATIEPIRRASQVVGWKEVEADGTLLMARCRYASGSLDEARALATQAMEVAVDTGLPRVTWESHAVLAGVLAAGGDAAGAEEHLASAGPIIERLADSLDRGMRRAYRRTARDGLRRLGSADVGSIRSVRR
jgi:hypothetical protein